MTHNMKKIILSLLAIAAMTGCTKSSEEEIDPNAPVEIEFGATIASTSRAVLKENSAFNAYVVREDVEGLTEPTFVKLTPIEANVDNAGKVTIASQYYDTDNKTSYFIGFTADKTTTAATGESTATVSYTGIDGLTDIMATKKLSAGSKTNKETVILAYQHLLSQLQFKFIAGANFPETGIKVSSLKIKNVKNAATLTLGDTPSLAFTGDATNEYTIFTSKEYEITKAGTNATEAALVEANLASIELEITANGVIYNSTVTLTTAASQAHVITLTFLPSNATFGTATIGTWSNGAAGTGDAQ